MKTETIVLIVVCVLLLITIITIIVYKYTEGFSVASSPHRPEHPKFYEDIPDGHPEVLQLQRETLAQMRETPTFTKDGFLQMDIPKDIYKKLLEHVRRTDRVPEGPGQIFRRTSVGLPPYLIPIGDEFRKEIEDSLAPILGEWSGLGNLQRTSIYGPREYRRGSSLRMHVDIGDTHIISAILQIDRQGMDKDWPLVVINRQGQRQNIYLRSGEMLLYESASLPHSREIPLEGDYFVNLFIHFAPTNYKELKKSFNEKRLREIE